MEQNRINKIAVSELIKQRIAEHMYLVEQLYHNHGSQLIQATNLMAYALKNGRKILFCGNGGSAADAQHLAAEFVGRFELEREGMPAIALTTDSSILTAVSNDYGFEQVFARQVQALGQREDILFAFSTSGNSPNVLAAIQVARDKGIPCIGFTGYSGGKMAAECDICIAVDSKVTARTQEMHILMGHILCEILDGVLMDNE